MPHSREAPTNFYFVVAVVTIMLMFVTVNIWGNEHCHWQFENCNYIYQELNKKSE